MQCCKGGKFAYEITRQLFSYANIQLSIFPRNELYLQLKMCHALISFLNLHYLPNN